MRNAPNGGVGNRNRWLGFLTSLMLHRQAVHTLAGRLVKGSYADEILTLPADVLEEVAQGRWNSP